jgi:hypothetical protein
MPARRSPSRCRPTQRGGNLPAVSYLLFVWSPAGYTLRELEGDPPHVGDEFEEGELKLVVNKIGISPLPGDTRACVFSVGAN